MWQVSSCKEIDMFKWSPKGYTIKRGKEVLMMIEFNVSKRKGWL